jgi:phosphoribosyl-AMP cyclohydrolase
MHQSTSDPAPYHSGFPESAYGLVTRPGSLPPVSDLEEGTVLGLDWDKLSKIGAAGQRVVPVVLQEDGTGEVLFVGYANEEALEATLQRRSAVLWSTSRDELWHKGATSGDTLELVDVRVNCEQNSLLYLVRRQAGGACHTRGAEGATRPGCYYRRLEDATTLSFVES